MTQSWTEAFSPGRININNFGFQEAGQKIIIRKKRCKRGKATCTYLHGRDRRVTFFSQFIENREMSLLTLSKRVSPMEEGTLLPWEPAGSWSHCPCCPSSCPVPLPRGSREGLGGRRQHIPSWTPFSSASPQENKEESIMLFSLPSMVLLTHQSNPTPWLTAGTSRNSGREALQNLNRN